MALREGSIFRCLCQVVFLAAALRLEAAPRANVPELEVRHWSSENGMPDVAVTSIQQTREGFLWVGTVGGLARFDGWAFQVVNFSDKPPVKGPVAVTAQCVDSSNRLWFGTERDGVFTLDPAQTGRLKAEPAGLAGEKVLCLGADEGEVVWIGTERGLVKAERGRFTRIAPEQAEGDQAVLALQVTRSSGLWLTTRAGLRKFQDGKTSPGQFPVEGLSTARFLGVFEDRQGSLWGFGDTYLLNVTEGRRFNYFRGGGATPLQVWSICQGRPGELWIGTTGQGLFHFGGSRFHAVDLRDGPDASNVRAVFLDREGQLWVGTDKGLLRLRERVVRWYTGPGSPATALAEDSENRIWAGFEHGGLASGRLGLLEPAGVTVPLAAQNLISSLYARGDGSLWVGTLGNGLYRMRDGKVLRYSTADGLTDDTILALCGTVAGRVWASTPDGRVHRFLEQHHAAFDIPEGLTGQPVTALAAGSETAFWAGTAQGEILAYRPQEFRKLPTPPGFAGVPVSALRLDAKERLWAGSRGAGVACFSRGTWRAWNTDSGLPDNTVLGIEQSLSGEIWVATFRGITRLPATWPEDLERRDSRPPVLVEFPATPVARAVIGSPRSLRARDGTLWFATDHGVVNFLPAELKLAAPAPEVRIEQIRANGTAGFETRLQPAGSPGSGKAPASRALRLPAGLRELDFRFTAPGLAFPERTRFRHMLEGFDPDWQDSTANRQARYGKLSAGRYVFRVTATDAVGGWSGPETRVALTVSPPLWQTWWAILLTILLVVALTASIGRAVWHRRLRRQLAGLEQQRAMERERSRIAQDMHDELGAKLTKISFLSERARNDVVRASPTSAQLDSIAVTSRELLHSLDEIVWAVNPRNDNLEHLAAYLAQYATEYLQNTQVQFDLRMPGALPDHPISAEVRHHLFLAFEEALSNALKHSGASHLRVDMIATAGDFRVSVKDNGRGLPPESSLLTPAQPKTTNAPTPRRRGSGLNSMRDRLTRSGGRCHVQSAPGEGTTVVLSIPLAPASEPHAHPRPTERTSS